MVVGLCDTEVDTWPRKIKPRIILLTHWNEKKPYIVNYCGVGDEKNTSTCADAI